MLRTVEDAERLANAVTDGPRTAVVIGAGFIGLEMAENLAERGLAVTVVEAAPQVLTPLDPELAILVAAELVRNGIAVETGVAVARVSQEGVIRADGREIAGALVVGAIGVRPDVRLAEMAGLLIGPSGGIEVDASGRTSDPDIYAVGDAVEKHDSVGGGGSLIALANIANRQGRRVADDICGLAVRSTPSLGTAIVKVFGITAAMTGWNEQRLRVAGRQYRAIHSHPMSHAGYYPGAEPMSLKLLFDPVDGTILGAQAVGGAGVDKRIDVLATAMAGGLRADELANLELAYDLRFRRPRIRSTCSGTWRRTSSPGNAMSWRPMSSRPFFPRVGHSSTSALRVNTPEGPSPAASTCRSTCCVRSFQSFGKGPFVVYCEVGQRGHTATSLLHELGIEARNVDGGYRTWLAADAAHAGDPLRLATRHPEREDR